MCNSLIIALNTAEELIEALDRSKWGRDPVEWIFRGQRSHDWHILPTAWRPKERYLLDDQWQSIPLTNNGQCQSEYELARRFFRIGDVQGLPLPGDNPELRARMIESNKFDKTQPWPPRALEWLIAIAQHYGVPTRFVDWTRKPLIAAWFAAEEAARQYGEKEEERDALPIAEREQFKMPEGRFIIWALHRKSEVLKQTGWEVTGAPRAVVPNLHLQSGLFTFRRVAHNELDCDKDATPLCEAILKSGGDQSTLRAVSVPWSQAGRTLTLLRDRFVQAATVYAGYEGVAKSVKEPRWRRPL